MVIRHLDRRIRVLLAFSPSGELVEIESTGGSLPFSFALQDIVIVREMLNRRPINDDLNPDILWSPVNEELLLKPLKGRRLRANISGLVDADPVVMNFLNADQREDSHSAQVSTDFSRLFPGGILVQSVSTVSADTRSTCRISWAPSCELENTDSLCYSAEVRFIYRPEVGQRGDSVFVIPPRLEDFFIDVMRPDSLNS